ncbi:hypothetical protein DY000_02039996 [Brassica cretica]|uniref:Uncharacterized protein n=1 Tax=Brassica cretica TaxID=69181 RepID=A0ABQ7BHV3_BRACR|nr:hypothetical protein DY000_02039996 [Brassica cretica]
MSIGCVNGNAHTCFELHYSRFFQIALSHFYLADVTRQLRGHAEQIYAQANPREVDPAGIAGEVRGALAQQPIRARRGEQAEEDEEREELADEEDGR